MPEPCLAMSRNLGLREIRRQDELDVEVGHGVGRRALERLLCRFEPQLQVVGGATVGEGMDPQAAVDTAHDFGLASAVVDAFEGIGQGFADKGFGIREHLSDCRAGEFRIVER